MTKLGQCDNCNTAMPKAKLRFFWWKGADLCPDCHDVRWSAAGLLERRPAGLNTFHVYDLEERAS